MSTDLKNIVPPELNADDEAIIEHVMTGKRLEPDLVKRVRERAERITRETYEKHGLLDIAIPAIRELRDSE